MHPDNPVLCANHSQTIHKLLPIWLLLLIPICNKRIMTKQKQMVTATRKPNTSKISKLRMSIYIANYWPHNWLWVCYISIASGTCWVRGWPGNGAALLSVVHSVLMAHMPFIEQTHYPEASFIGLYRQPSFVHVYLIVSIISRGSMTTNCPTSRYKW